MIAQCEDSRKFSTAFAQALSYALANVVARAQLKSLPRPEIDMVSVVSRLTKLPVTTIEDMRDGLAFRQRSKVALVAESLFPFVGNERAAERLIQSAQAMTPCGVISPEVYAKMTPIIDSASMQQLHRPWRLPHRERV
ncbi:MAG: hypothetical protein WAW92_00075 [Minisyncoccia bacterium]